MKDWTIAEQQLLQHATEADLRCRAEEAKQAAARHDPIIQRTLLDGPGNRRNVSGCACGNPDVHDAKTWADHVGLGSPILLERLLQLQDAAEDAVDYPEKETRIRLWQVLQSKTWR